MLKALSVSVALVLTLAACSTFSPVQYLPEQEKAVSPFQWRPQEYDGLTAIYVTLDDKGNPSTVSIISGKEAKGLVVSYARKDGTTVSYSVGDLKAFEGQKSRAEVEKYLAGELGSLWKDVTPQIKDSLVSIISKLLTGGVL